MSAGRPPKRLVQSVANSMFVDTASDYLVALARQNAQVYVARCAPRAILLAGSAAEGLADYYSDIDMIVFYDTMLPSDEQLGAVRAEIGAEAYRPLYPRDEGRSCGEGYRVRGVECQVGHSMVSDVEERIAPVLDGREPASLQQKAIMGHRNGIALYGDDLVLTWRVRGANFSDQLARGMVEHYLCEIFPLWYIAAGLENRDAGLWVRETLATAALNVIGVLAGLNKRYYVPFQFKRTRRFLESLTIAPNKLADRLNDLLLADQPTAITQMEDIVRETLALVNQYMPEIDTAAILRREPGERQEPWHVQPLDG